MRQFSLALTILFLIAGLHMIAAADGKSKGKAGQKGQLPPHYTACDGKAAGESCSFTGRNSETINDTCQDVNGKLTCGTPGGKSEDGKGGGGLSKDGDENGADGGGSRQKGKHGGNGSGNSIDHEHTADGSENRVKGKLAGSGSGSGSGRAKGKHTGIGSKAHGSGGSNSKLAGEGSGSGRTKGKHTGAGSKERGGDGSSSIQPSVDSDESLMIVNAQMALSGVSTDQFTSNTKLQFRNTVAHSLSVPPETVSIITVTDSGRRAGVVVDFAVTATEESAGTITSEMPSLGSPAFVEELNTSAGLSAERASVPPESVRVERGSSRPGQGSRGSRQQNSDKKEGSKGFGKMGLLVAVLVGAVILVALVVCIGCCVFRKQQSQEKVASTELRDIRVVRAHGTQLERHVGAAAKNTQNNISAKRVPSPPSKDLGEPVVAVPMANAVGSTASTRRPATGMPMNVVPGFRGAVPAPPIYAQSCAAEAASFPPPTYSS